MKLDIPEILKALARKRPVFHSVAGFQHALAWQIHEMHPVLHPRLEYPFEPSEKKSLWHGIASRWQGNDSNRTKILR